MSHRDYTVTPNKVTDHCFGRIFLVCLRLRWVTSGFWGWLSPCLLAWKPCLLVSSLWLLANSCCCVLTRPPGTRIYTRTPRPAFWTWTQLSWLVSILQIWPSSGKIGMKNFRACSILQYSMPSQPKVSAKHPVRQVQSRKGRNRHLRRSQVPWLVQLESSGVVSVSSLCWGWLTLCILQVINDFT